MANAKLLDVFLARLESRVVFHKTSFNEEFAPLLDQFNISLGRVEVDIFALLERNITEIIYK